MALLLLLLCSFAVWPVQAFALERDASTGGVSGDATAELAAVAGSAQTARLVFGGSAGRPEIVWEFSGSTFDAAKVASLGIINLSVTLALEDLGTSDAARVQSVLSRPAGAVAPAASSEQSTASPESLVMIFDKPGVLPGAATVSVAVPPSFEGIGLLLYAIDPVSANYQLREGNLLASGGYATFTVATMETLVLSSGEPAKLPAALLSNDTGSRATAVGNAPLEASIPEPSSLAQGGTVGAESSKHAPRYTSASDSVNPPVLTVASVCVLVALLASALMLAYRHKLRMEEVCAMNQGWTGGGYSLQELPGLQELMDTPKEPAEEDKENRPRSPLREVYVESERQ